MPLSSELGTHKAVKARFWRCLSDKSLLNSFEMFPLCSAADGVIEADDQVPTSRRILTKKRFWPKKITTQTLYYNKYDPNVLQIPLTKTFFRKDSLKLTLSFSNPYWSPSTAGPIKTFFFFITLGLELSDTKVYEPYIRALLGTASHYLYRVGHDMCVGLSDSALLCRLEKSIPLSSELGRNRPVEA